MSTTFSSTAWILRPRPSKQTQLRLFCFPYAGGSASAFQSWRQYLPDAVDLCLIQLPGREMRLREKAYSSLPSLLNALTPVLLPYLDQPFVFFGHSMGAMICFELARSLRQRQSPQPLHLFVSGCRAPHLPATEPAIHALPESELIAALKRLNGTPPSLLENRELMELLLPMLRADFALFETYNYIPKEPLSCPITAFGGLQDTRATSQQISHWYEHTHTTFTLHMFPGDHFFILEARKELLEKILQASSLLYEQV
jgi:medium-chain acyl-[acyl-carrier-protein] hydrolase